MIRYLASFLYRLYRPNGILFIDPLTLMAIAGGTQLLANTLPRIIGKKKRERRLEEAGRTFQTPDEYGEAARIAEGMVSQGDPNYNRTIQAIRQGETNALGTVRRTTGNVSDILSVIQGLNRTSTDSTMAATAADTAFRLNAKRYLASAKSNLGAAKVNTVRSNFAAKQAELARQQQNIQGWAQAGGNIANDIASFGIAKEYGFFGDQMNPVISRKYGAPQ